MVSGLKSAKLKLARAAKQLRAIKKCINSYSASKPHKIVTKAKGNKKLNVPKGPPQHISILAGEMVYQMRSALDHLAFALVKKNPNIARIEPNWSERCQFPLKTKLPKGSTPPLSKKDFSNDVPGISDEAFVFIESIQPYYRKGAPNSFLGYLAHLSNIDKHRHLNLIRPRIRASQRVEFRSGRKTGSFQALDRGAIISPSYGKDESDRPVKVHRRYRTFAAFNEGKYLGHAATFPVDVLLEAILYNIDTYVVPAFEKFVK